MTPGRRRWRIYRSQTRSVISGIFLLALTFFSLTAEMWSNDRPLILHYGGSTYFPAMRHYKPSEFGKNDVMQVDYKSLRLGNSDWALWPINRWGPYRINRNPAEYPAPPSRENWLGTDDRGRDI